MTTSHACEDGWVCEKHPAKPFPHDDCAGPGMPCGMLEHEGLWLEPFRNPNLLPGYANYVGYCGKVGI